MQWMKCLQSTAILFFLTVLASISCFALQADDLRGKRFCEVIISKGSVFEVYNTIRLNDCPEAAWRKLNEYDLKKETGSSYVILNGPRRFIIDGVKNTEFIDSKPKTFQGLAMRKCGLLYVSLRETLYGSQPFREHHVIRKTTWVYAAGKKVYELIDREGHVYVMQSFALSPNVRTEKDLVNLEKCIQLPRGWQFKTGVLAKENDLVAIHQKAIILQDNMKNTYQLATHDFL